MPIGGAPPCERCGERVYYNEQKMYMMKYWHKKCFKCDCCSKLLSDIGMAALLEDASLVCNQCVRKLTAQPAGDQPKEAHVDMDDPKNCPRCGKTVFFAEEKLALGRKWHQMCFSCAECHHKLDSRNIADHEGEVFCKSCHGKKYGPTGYGYAGGAGTMLSMDKGQELRSRNGSGGPKQEYMNQEDPDCCPRCGKKVYFAEQILAMSRKYHKLCFKCGACNKKVDSTSATDHEGELYCKACHGRKFGPKGYGYAGGAGTMLSMDTGKRYEITRDNVPHTAEAYVAPVADKLGDMKMGNGDEKSRPIWGGGDYCPRCNTIVYAAEKKMGAGNAYHATCYTCNSCHKKLDSSVLTEKDGEIYCKNCYGKKFGPKGYGFGSGAGILQTN